MKTTLEPNNKISVDCFTEREYQRVLSIFEKEGLRWYDGSLPTYHYKTYWGKGRPISLRYEDNFTYCRANINYNRECGYTSVTAKDFIKEKSLKKEFTLPNKWYVTVTVRNREVLSKWRFDTYDEAPSWFNVGAVVGYCKNSDSKEWDDEVNDNWENEITFQQFKKYVLKENQNTKTTKDMKAFKIMGSEPLLEAISKELLKLGYKWDDRLSLSETSSPLYIASEGDQQIWTGFITTMRNYTTFSLPKEYDEALAFAKSLLSKSNSVKFEMGKWYKYNGYYIKYERTNSENLFVSSEFIDRYGHKEGESYFGEANCEKILLTDLSEIQEFLPDGHPDKKFIPKKGDCIYHNHGDYGWIAIFSEFRNGQIIGEHSLSSKGSKNFYLTYRNSNDDSELRLATPEEKQWLDACIKAGKFVSKEKALHPKHKLSNCVHGKVYWSNNSYYPKGHIWRFDKIKDERYVDALSMIYDNLVVFEVDSGLNDAHWENLREATSEEIAWLEACEKENRFISKEEALETGGEKLLKEAKRRYPIGTTVIGVDTKDVRGNLNCGKKVVIGGNYRLQKAKDYEGRKSDAIYCVPNVYVYSDGQWAEIIPEIKKWDVGTYVVFLKDYGFSKKGDVDKIIESNLRSGKTCICEKEGSTTKDEKYVKWFATKKEAEEFAKTLIAPVYKERDYVCVVKNVYFEHKKVGDVFQILRISNSSDGTVYLYFAQCASVTSDRVRMATKDEIDAYKASLTYKFGNTIVTIDEATRTAKCEYGTITFDEIEKVVQEISRVEKSKILGFSCSIPSLKVGCQTGTYDELMSIYNALKDK